MSDIRLHERAWLSTPITQGLSVCHTSDCLFLTSTTYTLSRQLPTARIIHFLSLSVFGISLQAKMQITHFSVFSALLGASEAFFRMSCPGRLVRQRLDPIINPGGVAGHVHTISGGAGFAPTMTYETMRRSNCSSCTIKVCSFSGYQKSP